MALTAAVVAAPGPSLHAARHTWPPFVLVAGLLLIGVVAHVDGTFDRAAAAVARVGSRQAVLLTASLALVAAVTAVLNLDTAAAFLTPVLILTARSRGVPEQPFVLGSLVMANAASLLLPGSNLTNLLILGSDHLNGITFAARMLPAWAAAVVVTAAVVLAYGRLVSATKAKAKANASDTRPSSCRPPTATLDERSGVVGVAATVAAAVAMVALPSPALPVVAIGAAAVIVRLAQRRLGWRRLQDAVGISVLAGLFSLATALWTLASTWSGPSHLVAHLSGWGSATLGALASVALNNLPAAALLGSHAAAHPRALLLGLDLGPNLAVTGSLSALLWYQAARQVGVRPSLGVVSKVGVVLVPLSLGAALLALQLGGRF